MRYVLFTICVIATAAVNGADGRALRGIDGNTHSLAEYIGQGRWVMVNVWSPGCPHCITELPTLQAFHQGNDANAIVIGIAVNYPGFTYPDADELGNFAVANDIKFPLLLADGRLASAFVGDDVDVIPLTFAFDPHGRMVARWHGVITAPDIDEIIRDFSVADR